MVGRRIAELPCGSSMKAKEVPMRQRILRDFRQLMRRPTKFLAFNKKVKHALTNNPNCPESLAPLLREYFEKVDHLDTTYHVALDGAHSVVRERDRLSEEIAVLLDKIASALESALMMNPDALLTTGFSLTQERRSTTRVKLPLPSPSDFRVENLGEQGRASGTASSFTGALLHEVHVNQKDPAVEADWLHKGIFTDPQNMVMDNLYAGNTFFRMRHYGQDGPGPWSAVVSTTIT